MTTSPYEPYVAHCPFCGKATTIYADPRDVERWQNGELIQKAMPNLTPSEREVFISGICYNCQKKIFG